MRELCIKQIPLRRRFCEGDQSLVYRLPHLQEKPLLVITQESTSMRD